jgi:AcrR family transcriptional regulator
MATETDRAAAPLNGRRAQAARNDEVILAAARAVFLENPQAPISAVAERAGVGISALYRRYPSKEDLLRRLCGDGLTAYLAAVREALDALDTGADPWPTFAAFVRRVLDAGSASLASRLAGTFTPTEELYRDGALGDQLNHQLVDRLRTLGVLRPDIEVADLSMILEMLATVRLGDQERTGQLRRRYLTLVLDALHHSGSQLPGPPPDPADLAARWQA